MCNRERWLCLKPLARRLKLVAHIGWGLRLSRHPTHSRTLQFSGSSTPLFRAFLEDSGRGVRYWREFRRGSLCKDRADMDAIRLSLCAYAAPFWKTAVRQRWCWFESCGEVVPVGSLDKWAMPPRSLFDLPEGNHSPWPGGVWVAAKIPGPYREAYRDDLGVSARLPEELVREFQLWLSELLKRKAKSENRNLKAIRRKVEIGRRIALLKNPVVS